MLLDPQGNLVTSSKPEKVFTNPDIARFVSMADVPFRVLGLTVVCLQCGGSPQMANHPADGSWFMECACTKRVLRNPDQVRARKAS